jgi:hypothetical protein
MRWILALVMAGALCLGTAKTSHAQVAVGVSPWGGFGVSVGNPYGYYSSGYYGLGGVGLGGIGLAPTTTVYSSGYYGVAPMTFGYRSYSYPMGYGFYPSYGYGFGGYRRGWIGGRRFGRYW